MERRKFLKSTAIGSTSALAVTMTGDDIITDQNQAKHKCKIKVIKRTFNKEWDKKYGDREGIFCDMYIDGQEFIIKDPRQIPEGFCSKAWGNIQTLIHLVNEGRFDSFVSCCTDGFRPVFFKIERIKA
jgi:uncharacterized repeat protein (TIGR04076 family)